MSKLPRPIFGADWHPSAGSMPDLGALAMALQLADLVQWDYDEALDMHWMVQLDDKKILADWLRAQVAEYLEWLAQYMAEEHHFVVQMPGEA